MSEKIEAAPRPDLVTYVEPCKYGGDQMTLNDSWGSGGYGKVIIPRGPGWEGYSNYTGFDANGSPA